MALKAAPGGPIQPAIPVDRPAAPRPSLVPKIRPTPGPHFPARASGTTNASWPGSPHIAALVSGRPAADMSDAGQDNAETIDDSVPACDASLNPPQGEPRRAPDAGRGLVVSADSIRSRRQSPLDRNSTIMATVASGFSSMIQWPGRRDDAFRHVARRRRASRWPSSARMTFRRRPPAPAWPSLPPLASKARLSMAS